MYSYRITFKTSLHIQIYETRQNFSTLLRFIVLDPSRCKESSPNSPGTCDPDYTK